MTCPFIGEECPIPIIKKEFEKYCDTNSYKDCGHYDYWVNYKTPEEWLLLKKGGIKNKK